MFIHSSIIDKKDTVDLETPGAQGGFIAWRARRTGRSGLGTGTSTRPPLFLGVTPAPWLLGLSASVPHRPRFPSPGSHTARRLIALDWTRKVERQTRHERRDQEEEARLRERNNPAQPRAKNRRFPDFRPRRGSEPRL
jgi:hypothetical protein